MSCASCAALQALRCRRHPRVRAAAARCRAPDRAAVAVAGLRACARARPRPAAAVVVVAPRRPCAALWWAVQVAACRAPLGAAAAARATVPSDAATQAPAGYSAARDRSRRRRLKAGGWAGRAAAIRGGSAAGSSPLQARALGCARPRRAPHAVDRWSGCWARRARATATLRAARRAAAQRAAPLRAARHAGARRAAALRNRDRRRPRARLECCPIDPRSPAPVKPMSESPGVMLSVAKFVSATGSHTMIWLDENL